MIEPRAKQTFTTTATLTEAELRLLVKVTDYDVPKILGASIVLRPEEAELLARIIREFRDDAHRCTAAFDAARKAFNEACAKQTLPVNRP